MKPKLFSLFLALVASVGIIFASDTSVDGIWYDFNSSTLTASVTYRGSSYSTYADEYSGSVVIPASVTYSGQTYSVTSIGDFAFVACSGLTSVTIPNSVTSIGVEAFNNCSGLKSVTIGNNVTSIGSNAFSFCSGLTSVIIPNSVTSISYAAFAGCSGLTSIIVESGNSMYDSRDNCNAIIETSTNTLIVGCQNTAIPNSVTSIGGAAFYECTGLTSVTIPNSVTSIGVEAFSGCSSLTSVTIGNSVTSIGDLAFADCDKLVSVFCENTKPAQLLIVEWTGIGFPPTFTGTPSSMKIYVPCGSLNAYQSSWSDYASLIKYKSLPYTLSVNVNSSDEGHVNHPQGELTECDNHATIEAVPNYGYHFTQWSDGNTDNPRTIVVTQDTTFTAEFAKTEYTITTASSNSEWGSTAGGKKALYLDEVEISATPNYGYHFVSWNDGNTNNPRTITITKDETYTATFAKNTYSIAKQTNAEQGYISGASQAEYLDYVTLTAVPNYGCHFTQWSDGLKDNPRIFVITQDTAFTAEFAYDRVGQCGKDLALVWSYDPVAKVLTLGNAGAFTENMQFGAEAPKEMEELVIGHNVTSIGDRAFSGIETLKKITIGESVKTIGEQAFYNCVNLETIYNYRATPTNAYSTAFDGVDKFECALYVLPNSIDLYKSASVWRDFYYTYAIGATAATVNEVSVTPAVNTAAVAWPAVENAFTYELVIKDKSGNIVCTLVFNANGQLTAIAFAAPGRAQASTQATGFSFTVTGLDGGTGYDLTINAKDSQGEIINTTTQSFTTVSDTTTGVDATLNASPVRKLMIDGQLFILRDGKTYTAQGQEVR